MLISELVNKLNLNKSKYGDVKVKVVCPMNSGFQDIDELLHRSDYYDSTMYGEDAFGGHKLESGNFIAIEVK